MTAELKLMVNGKERSLPGLDSPTTMDRVLQGLELRADRIAVELNGELAPRTAWPQTAVAAGDRIEIVHFVGGGAD